MSERTNKEPGQNVPKSKLHHKSQQEQLAASKLRMEKRSEQLDKAKEKLAKQKPVSLGAAGRIPGVNPADVAVLTVWLEKRRISTPCSALPPSKGSAGSRLTRQSSRQNRAKSWANRYGIQEKRSSKGERRIVESRFIARLPAGV